MGAHHKITEKKLENPDRERFVRLIEQANLPPLLRPCRIGKLLDMDKRRVYELIASGDLASVRAGVRGARVFRESLIEWLRKGGTGE